MKRIVLWAERRWERYNYGRDYPSVMLWLITAGAFLTYANAIKIVAQYYPLLPKSLPLKIGLVIFMYPFVWITYYKLHKTFKRFSEENPAPNERLAKRLQFLSIAFVLGAYILFNFLLSIIGGLLRSLHH